MYYQEVLKKLEKERVVIEFNKRRGQVIFPGEGVAKWENIDRGELY